MDWLEFEQITKNFALVKNKILYFCAVSYKLEAVSTLFSKCNAIFQFALRVTCQYALFPHIYAIIPFPPHSQQEG